MKARFAVVMLAGLACAVTARAGVYYEATMSGQGGRGAAMQDQKVQAWVSGDSAKVAFVESRNPMMKAGGYMITKNAKDVFFVDPKEKSYWKFDLEGMGQFAGGAMKMMNMKFSNPKVEKLLEEPGPVIAGMPTVHFKFRTSYGMEMSFMGMHRASNIVQDQEIWAAPKLVEAALGIWLHKAPKFGNEDLDKLVQAEMSKVQGFPLKTVTVQTTTDQGGKSQTTTTTMEVTTLRTESVPDSTFVIPPDYKETQMMAPGGMMRPGPGNQN